MLPKILLLSDIFPPKTGGSGRWFWEIYSRLPRDRVVVATGMDERSTEFDQTHNLQVRRLPLTMATRGLRPFGNLKHYLKTAWRIRRLVKHEGITAIHAGRNLPEGFLVYLVRRLTGVPYICYVHGEDVGVSATSRELAWMTRRVFAKASAVIANSQNTRAMLLNEWKLPEAKVHLLYPGVDTKRFVPASRDETVRQSLGWQDRKVLLTVGRLQKRKGHDMLIRALPAIRERHPDVLYAILGEGEERSRLQELANSSPHTPCAGVGTRSVPTTMGVQFLGEIDDAQLLTCYQQCDLFVLPNRAIGRDVEGFGMVLLEAQACGKPVVAGESGGTAETMSIPDTGRIVPCESPELLAQLLIELLDDPTRLDTMGQAGRAWVQEHFDWDSLAVQAGEVFAKVGK